MTLPYSILCSSQILMGMYGGSGYRMRLCFRGVSIFDINEHHLDISKIFRIFLRAKIIKNVTIIFKKVLIIYFSTLSLDIQNREAEGTPEINHGFIFKFLDTQNQEISK